MGRIIPLYPPTDRTVVRSKGCYQYDDKGKKYIDFESGVWCANIGHSHDAILEVMEQQIHESIHHGYKFTSPQAEALSLKLQEITGLEDGASIFLSSGSEAVELSIRLARHITSKQKVLKIGNSYLSAYGVGRVAKDNDDVIEVPIDDMESLEAVDFNDIAAFIMEVGGCSIDMVRVPSAPYVHRIIELCRQNQCLVIAEEVTTGMGRMGQWYGYQCYGIMPDMVVSGKALGNGYPVSAVTMDHRMLEAFAREPFIYAQSHQNDPMGCAVGLAVISVIEDEGLLERCHQMGDYLRRHLMMLMQNHPQKVKEVRGQGLMQAIQLTDTVDGAMISMNLLDRGFVVGFKANSFRLLPPLVIAMDDIDRLIEALDDEIANA